MIKKIIYASGHNFESVKAALFPDNLLVDRKAKDLLLLTPEEIETNISYLESRLEVMTTREVKLLSGCLYLKLAYHNGMVSDYFSIVFE